MKHTIVIAGLLLLGCSKHNPQLEKSIEQLEPAISSVVSPTGPNAHLPYLTSDGGQRLFLSWVETANGTKTFKYAQLHNHQWLAAEDVFQGPELFINWADYPMIGVNQAGIMANYMLVTSEEKFSNDIQVVGKSNSGSWSQPTVPHSDRSLVQHGFVSIIPGADDNFQLAWLDGREGGLEGDEHYGVMTLQSVTANLEGLTGEEQVLDSYVCSCCQISGTMTEQGPLLVYRDRSPEEIRDISIVRLVNNVWTKPQTIYDDNWTIAGCPVNGPQVDSKGENVAIAWFTAPENKPEVKVIFSTDAGASFGQPVLIDNQFPIGRVDLVVIDESRAMVSWMCKQGEQTLIKGQVVHVSGETEPAFTIAETNASRATGFPQMARIGDTMYFAWTHLLEDENTEIRMGSVDL